MQRAVTLQTSEGIARILFRRPEAGNAIDLQFGREFREATERAMAAPETRVLVMTGEGKNFCVGGDLKAMLASGVDIATYLKDLTRDLHAGIINLYRGPAPVIAAVNGTAAGAGLGLVLAADIAIAARSAKFVAAYTAVGLSPDAGSTFALPRAIGRTRATDMLLNNRVLDAPTALSWGLVNEVVEDARLAEAVDVNAAKLAAGPKQVFSATKRLLDQSLRGLADQLEQESGSIAARGDSAEGREGIQAFVAKRPPDFRKAARGESGA
jgi:2-(1,2-epoxy-1,2-dihydrophenyl)acetyl-CoA isomerase